MKHTVPNTILFVYCLLFSSFSITIIIVTIIVFLILCIFFNHVNTVIISESTKKERKDWAKSFLRNEDCFSFLRSFKLSTSLYNVTSLNNECWLNSLHFISLLIMTSTITSQLQNKQKLPYTHRTLSQRAGRLSASGELTYTFLSMLHIHWHLGKLSYCPTVTLSFLNITLWQSGTTDNINLPLGVTIIISVHFMKM